MKLESLASAVLSIIVSIPFVQGADSPDLPSPWQHQDIGDVTVAGNASAADGIFKLKGTLDIWGTNDGCHFTWQMLKGDGAIVARVLSVEQTQGHAKGGVAIRESLTADARHATMVDTPMDGTQFLVREESGGKTTVQRTDLNKGTMPYWVKLVRVGDKLTGYESIDGKEWKQTGSATLKLSEAVYIGLVASSHLKDKLCAAAFDQVAITKDAK
jgi:regulation of enolase protein 1 (concanavalin A-like superfamily)